MYDADPAFALQARMIILCTFVPVQDVNDNAAFDALSDELPDELGPILDWFEYRLPWKKKSKRQWTETGYFPATDVECL